MGDIADGMINGDFDSFTGEYIGEGQGFPRTKDKEHAEFTSAQLVEDSDGNIRPLDHDPKNYSKGTRAIRKELAILIKTTIKDNPDKNENQIVNECRQAINKKYGKGWREQF